MNRWKIFGVSMLGALIVASATQCFGMDAARLPGGSLVAAGIIAQGLSENWKFGILCGLVAMEGHMIIAWMLI